MNRNIYIGLGLLVLIGIVFFLNNKKNIENTIETKAVVSDTLNSEVKEFVMTSLVEKVDDKYKPQYSVKEIIVNKGDRVRIKITVASGMHDFKIDEFNVYADTKINDESVVEFTADKAGEFIYYCTKPGHRQNGHLGTLKVLDK